MDVFVFVLDLVREENRGMRDVAVALANERLALRPDSAPNHRFLVSAKQLAA